MAIDGSVDILIVVALQEEFQALDNQLRFGNKVHSEICELTYYLGQIKSEELGVSYTCAYVSLFRMGNPDAATGALNAIRDLSPAYVIMFGLAAGLRGEVELGDVIIPTHIFYYEQAKQRSDTVEVRPQSYRVDALTSNRLQDFVARQPNDRNYAVKFGPFAVGEKVISSQEALASLKRLEPKLLGVEMESYGVAAAAATVLHRPRFVAIRGVSDHADEHKDDAPRGRALQNASDFLLAFLKSGSLPKQGSAQLTQAEATKTLIAIHHLSLELRSLTEHSIEDTQYHSPHCEIKELRIDQTDLYNNGCLTSPSTAASRQADIIQRLNGYLSLYPQAHVGYFGLAHIPLMFLAGYQVNRRIVTTFGINRQTGKWQSLLHASSGPKLYLEDPLPFPANGRGDVVVRISISYMIRSEQVVDIVENPLAQFHLRLETPTPDVVRSEEQLDRYTRAFHGLLATINDQFPNTNRIHLFLAAPPPVVFRYGQQVSKTIDRNILVYNFSRQDQPEYGWAINVKTGEVLELRK